MPPENAADERAGAALAATMLALNDLTVLVLLSLLFTPCMVLVYFPARV
jgi:hypothetical protein